jgi:hypothetical protein
MECTGVFRPAAYIIHTVKTTFIPFSTWLPPKFWAGANNRQKLKKEKTNGKDEYRNINEKTNIDENSVTRN